MADKSFLSRLNDATNGILDDYNAKRDIDELNVFNRPQKTVITRLTDQLFRVVYPGFYGDKTYHFYDIRNDLKTVIEDIAYYLNKEINLVLRTDASTRGLDCMKVEEQAKDKTIAFLDSIPKVREYLQTDLEAFFDGDPAAESLDEIILAYPGFYTITVFRLAHELYMLGVPVIPRMMTEYAHSKTGIDINPGATIGKYFFMDHGTGIVIGETTEIGEHVKLYQGVTLGALSTRGGRKLQNKKRHPTIEDNVTIYSGASILGGETVIGRNCVIGGNVFLTSSVAPDTKVSVMNQELRFDSGSGKVTQVSESKTESEEPVWFYVI